MTIQEQIRAACFKAHRLGFRIIPVGRGLQFNGDIYVAGVTDPCCHPLEALLLGVERCTGDFKQDVATVLGVSKSFVDGFLKGIEQSLLANGWQNRK